ncbi:MAG: DUF2259 domain-containing protein [Deltaproteobacteria bacterium]|nr:DUF2259 domain-containing protein [Deltaproteobacteria bacterium]
MVHSTEYRRTTFFRVLQSSLMLVFLLGPASANAGDEAQLDIAGFTADGRFFVFEEYGVTSEEARPYSRIVVMDTHTGFRVKSSAKTQGGKKALEKAGDSVFMQRRGLMEIRKRAWKYAGDYYVDYDVFKVFPPMPVKFFLKPVLVQAETGNRKLGASFGPNVRSKAASKKGLSDKKKKTRRFELRLTTRNRATEDEQEALRNCSHFTIKAELVDHKSGRSVNLSDERIAPKWRRCIQRVDLVNIVVDRGRVAVMLSYTFPDEEGTSKRFMALTRKLP